MGISKGQGIQKQVKTSAQDRAGRQGQRQRAPRHRDHEKAHLAVQVARSAKAFKTLIAHIDRALAASATGIATDLVISVRPGKSHPRIAIRAKTVQAAPSADETPDLMRALAEARGRGNRLAADILRAPGMLSADALASRLNVARTTVHDKRLRSELLGLQGAKRGYRFPEWQVDAHGRLFLADVLPRLFEQLGDPWTIYRFLLQAHPELGGRTALNALRNGETDRVLETARNIACGSFS